MVETKESYGAGRSMVPPVLCLAPTLLLDSSMTMVDNAKSYKPLL